MSLEICPKVLKFVNEGGQVEVLVDGLQICLGGFRTLYEPSNL